MKHLYMPIKSSSSGLPWRRPVSGGVSYLEVGPARRPLLLSSTCSLLGVSWSSHPGRARPCTLYIHAALCSRSANRLKWSSVNGGSFSVFFGPLGDSLSACRSSFPATSVVQPAWSSLESGAPLLCLLFPCRFSHHQGPLSGSLQAFSVPARGASEILVGHLLDPKLGCRPPLAAT